MFERCSFATHQEKYDKMVVNIEVILMAKMLVFAPDKIMVPLLLTFSIANAPEKLHSHLELLFSRRDRAKKKSISGEENAVNFLSAFIVCLLRAVFFFSH